MNIPHFISIGHITHDLIGNGITLGGPALYSTCTARNLGASCGMVTSFSDPLLNPSFLHGIDIHCKKSHNTTTFANIYNKFGERHQVIEKIAETITPDFIPKNWRSANIVNICPVANEFPAEIIRGFDDALISVCPQGWMRQWDSKGNVSQKSWDNFQKILPYADMVFFSEQDVDHPEHVVEMYLAYTDIVIVTRGERGASVYSRQRNYHVPAFSVIEIDPTGAGDVFAAAFLLKYFDTRDPLESATFANCVASFVVEKEGASGIPTREDVMHRLKKKSRKVLS